MSGGRLGHRGLARLRERLSDRDVAIVGSVDEFHLLSARQIERLHFHDHASALSAARSCRRVLERLTRDRLVVRLNRRVGGVRAGSASYVYAIGPVGHRLLHSNSSRRWREPSHAFVTHTLAVADLAVELHQGNRTGDIELVEVEAEPRCWRRFTGSGGAAETLKPDLAVITADDAHEYRWFVEVDLGTESTSTIGRKCAIYTAYWRTGTEQHHHDVFPKALWVANTERRAGFIAAAISKARRIHQPLFAVTTRHKAIGVLAGGER